MPAQCFRLSPTGLSLFVRVTPNANRNAIEGIEQRDDGTAILRLRVTAVPDKGKANAAAIALLAKALCIPKSAISVSSGQTARLKTLTITGEPAVLQDRLGALERP